MDDPNLGQIYPLRIVFFAAGGDLATHALTALHQSQDVVAAICPRPHSRLRHLARRVAERAGIRAPGHAEAHARRLKIPTFTISSARDARLLAFVEGMNPDLLCIATFPWILPEHITSVPRFGTVNIHPSLLPRHRGPNPYFWTYHSNDASTGLTVHTATAQVDGGPILAQEEWELPRGQNVRTLHREMGVRAADLLRHVAESIERKSSRPIDQNEHFATQAPHPPRDRPMIDPDWDVERVWHFLAGVFPFFHEPLQHGGRAITYHGVTGFRREPAQAPGTIEPVEDGWTLSCRNGTVQLASRRAASGTE